MEFIVIEGASEHNLKGVSVRLPRERLIVMTGPSGSGKSSLAFDTLYAEGQRRYVESLSVYARQFLERLPKPKVSLIEGLSPAIAIEQRPLTRAPRSTVGTVTEISDYLRLYFARLGKPHCPTCGAPIAAQSHQEIASRLLALPSGSRITLLAPIVRGRKGELKLEIERLRREGFVRVAIDGTMVDLGDEISVERTKTHDLDVVVDRIVIKDGQRVRVSDSVELALRMGDGQLIADVDAQGSTERLTMSDRFACARCGISLPPIEPRLFSFNHPLGACPACEGLGAREELDLNAVIDEGRSLVDGAVRPWGLPGTVRFAGEMARALKATRANENIPWRDLPEKIKKTLLEGSAAYPGLISLLTSDEPETSDDGEAPQGGWTQHRTCSVCDGARLCPAALAVRVGQSTFANVCALSLDALAEWLTKLSQEPSKAARIVGEPLLKSMLERVGFLRDVGLGYLTLDRTAATLSGGEGQRIRLATQIGSALVGVMYVLDEPSVGLHPRDNARLLQALRHLVNLGNTVIVVEHDRDAILAADYVVDMGPGAGEHGGEIVAEGPPDTLIDNPRSVTGPFLRSHPISLPSAIPSEAFLTLRGATLHNLRNVTVNFPLGRLSCVTGVSGSGKSSLIMDILWPAARARKSTGDAASGFEFLEGLPHFERVICIDQTPIGRTPRSNPATFVGVFSLLRELFSSLPDARARGYKPGRFSFNVKGGRCEACQGDGVRRVEMHFLPDVFVECEDCRGLRYGADTLEIHYRGRSIADVLALTVREALELFEPVPRIRERLEGLRLAGLEYLKLGQPATTLSGGEAQRVKLGRELWRRAQPGRSLYILDEPTTGLHFKDIDVLMRALHELRDMGHTVIVIEHNLDVVAQADWVVDLGPEGGSGGGELLVEGPPAMVAATSRSHTGAVLRAMSEGTPSPTPSKKRPRRNSATTD